MSKFTQGFLFELRKSGFVAPIITTSALTKITPLRNQARLARSIARKTIPLKGTKSYVSAV